MSFQPPRGDPHAGRDHAPLVAGGGDEVRRHPLPTLLIASLPPLHHVLLAHGSHPNATDNRRIGLASRYIPTSAYQTKVRDSAMLVRGEDTFGNFDLETPLGLSPGDRFIGRLRPRHSRELTASPVRFLGCRLT